MTEVVEDFGSSADADTHREAEGPVVVPRTGRVKLSRAKGWRMPPDTVKVDRSTRWGNPFAVGSTYPISEGDLTGPIIGECKIEDSAAAVRAFRGWVTDEMVPPPFDDLSMLRGKHLACWCDTLSPCHADVLLELANREPGPWEAGPTAFRTACSVSGVRAGDDPQPTTAPEAVSVGTTEGREPQSPTTREGADR